MRTKQSIYTPYRVKPTSISISPDINRFTDIKELSPIPTNTIIDKTLPGIGATHSEIKERRNSILILPNVATIKNKHEKHGLTDATLAVHEGVSMKDIRAYLKKPLTYKKILTTPEGFASKVKPALGETMYSSYFLLLDECHKYITDSGYRQEIVLPMEDFFKFSTKAMISSTILLPSDIRLRTEQFKLLKVKPSYKYQKSLTVTETNNVLYHLLTLIQTSTSEEFYIFFNSIQGIINCIDALMDLQLVDLSSGYSIFCSSYSAQELRIKGYTNAFDSFTEAARFNFLTSSFYNGVDIEYRGNVANIVIVSDIKFADFTAVHPLTDVVQIRGRFRPYTKDGRLTDWVNEFTHIVRPSQQLAVVSKEEALNKIMDSKALYDAILSFKRSTSNSLTEEDVIAVLERVRPYYGLIDKDQNLNSYKVDNYLYKEEVRGFYNAMANLQRAYGQSKYFKVTFTRSTYIEEDKFKLAYGDTKYSVQNYVDVTNTLWDCEGTPTDYRTRLTVQKLMNQFPLITRAYFDLEMDIIVKLGFDHKLIMRALNFYDSLIGRNKFPVIEEVYIAFTVGKVYTLQDIKLKLQSILDAHKIDHRAKGEDIIMYFDVESTWPTIEGKRHRAFRLLRRSKNRINERV